MDKTLEQRLYAADAALAVADEASALPEATGDARSFRDLILAKLTYAVGKDPIVARDHDWLRALSLALRDRIVDRWMATTRGVYRMGGKRVYYFSLEFLIGRLLKDGLNNMGLLGTAREALASVGVDLDVIAELEADAALGNGGLGRLAACFMESMATVGVPAYGYGIRYENGLFRQNIIDGWQTESPENWLAYGNPWEFPRREVAYEIGFGGAVEASEGWDGSAVHAWKPAETVLAVAHDTPVVGWRGLRVNTLRLWSARSPDPISLDAFNAGDHIGALTARTKAESISRVLYPADSTPAGQELRLRQEYFFTSASLQDLVRRHLKQHREIRTLAQKAAVQLNDTHPAIAVAELMRILIDIHAMSWADAFALTRDTISYTNHTLLPEALESWPVPLLERLLPRHMQIIYAINARVLTEARAAGATDAMIAAVSIIDEGHGRRVRMGNLAFVGSHKVNGVSALHSELMKETVFRDLNTVFPGRITNKTNGITPRRWLMTANPGLAGLLRETIGEGFLDDAEKLVALEPFARDPGFQERFAAVKHANKARLAKTIQQTLGLRVDPAALFDVQVKRMHEYKRQLLNILETIALYNAIRTHPEKDWVPRVKVFAGKAAASYTSAKYIIKLINDVAKMVNTDPAVRNLLKVAFLPNYNVSLAEVIIPAADLSEQISTAGMEASGTGNMKFALNGALTIGTLDGANVEMRDHVGADNIFIFGLTAAEVEARRAKGLNPRANIEADPALAEVLDAVGSGVFSPADPQRHRGTVDNLTNSDWFLVTDDFTSYSAMQRRIDALWGTPAAWREKAILNVARMGWFSSDRTIRDYSDEIWGLPTVKVG
ncbi:glycogen/starch/alpha-glucan phosphorylase [Labrys wisconsinensis]|uniref:Alpha-1,4 glucan phosphorylase n=1 Tax=Labrys wisconsinensis TaxID=425677 RepID=A0ABU0J5V9_9HYPH|nr:glycogen/starch/alpha-glucan phosphorylase [Labrys wisconsinensis]MDQ0469645.1 starch phosphorylase [Labrys wisconsinensis]